MIPIEQTYAQMFGARAAFFVPAHNTVCALASLGLVGKRDRLIVFADDFAAEFKRRFDGGVLAFVESPLADDFVRASLEESLEPDEQLFWFVNSIGGYGLRVPKLRALAKAARAQGAKLIVDNTVASFFGCNPLQQGAYLCLEALDRVGKGELSEKLVAVSAASDTAAEKLCASRGVRGELFDAHELPSLPEQADVHIPRADEQLLESALNDSSERLQRHFDCARALAEYFSANEMVPAVYYPGLKIHEDHEAATGTLVHGFGPALDVELPAVLTAESFISQLPTAFRDAKAGGSQTRISPVKGPEANYIRIFSGLENPLEIAATFDNVLRAHHSK